MTKTTIVTALFIVLFNNVIARAESEAAPSVEDRLTKLEGQAKTGSALKFSGYIQGRYEWHQDAGTGVDPAKGNAPLGTNRFYVRRGRLKTTYAGDMSEFVLQVDATGEGVVVKDAESSLVLTNKNSWIPSAKPWELKVTFGQFLYTFGYDVQFSSSKREMPERAAVTRALFPGERDRGARLQFTYDWLRAAASLINGNGTGDAIYRSFDQGGAKDLLGRLGADFDSVAFGVSGYWGHALKTTLRPAMGATAATASYDAYTRRRVGADAQFHRNLAGLGEFALKGEFMWAKDGQVQFAGLAPDPADCKNITSFGWYLTAVQNVGQHLGVAVRFDQYDPNTGVKAACSDMLKSTVAQDRLSTLGVALLGYVSHNLKTTLAFEHLSEQGKSKDNDVVTLQMQAKF